VAKYQEGKSIEFAVSDLGDEYHYISEVYIVA
jgi:hypothetical protein